MKIFRISIIFGVLLLIGCGKEYELGTKKNPIKMYFVPSMKPGKLLQAVRK